MFDRPDKPESDFDEDDWAGVRFRNLIRLCVKSPELQENMREGDYEHFRRFRDAKDQRVGRKRKPAKTGG